jgi:hypothetical protein
MSKFSRIGKTLALTLSGAMLWGIGGGCLVDDFWVNKSSEVVNGLIIGVINILLAQTGTGIQI